MLLRLPFSDDNITVNPRKFLLLDGTNLGRFTLLQSLDLPDLWKHPGLNFEKLHGMIEPGTGQQLYSLRVTGSARAVTCLLSGPTLVLVSLHVQHDKAYRKR